MGPAGALPRSTGIAADLERNEPDAPTPEQIKLLIERAEEKDPELATLLFVAATTGCRRGELCGLRWSDVDFEKGVLLVRRSVSDLPGRVEIRSTKTGHIRKMALDTATSPSSSSSGSGRAHAPLHWACSSIRTRTSGARRRTGCHRSVQVASLPGSSRCATISGWHTSGSIISAISPPR